jgi:CheY-specific phosphatase CheX
MLSRFYFKSHKTFFRARQKWLDTICTERYLKLLGNLDIYAGKVEKKVYPMDSDVVGIIGIAGGRGGYIIFATKMTTANVLARDLMMTEEPDEESIRDAVGELVTISPVFFSPP